MFSEADFRKEMPSPTYEKKGTFSPKKILKLNIWNTQLKKIVVIVLVFGSANKSEADTKREKLKSLLKKKGSQNHLPADEFLGLWLKKEGAANFMHT